MISDNLRQRVLEKLAAPGGYNAVPVPAQNGPVLSSYDRRAAPAVPVPAANGPVQSSYDSRAPRPSPLMQAAAGVPSFLGNMARGFQTVSPTGSMSGQSRQPASMVGGMSPNGAPQVAQRSMSPGMSPNGALQVAQRSAVRPQREPGQYTHATADGGTAAGTYGTAAVPGAASAIANAARAPAALARRQQAPSPFAGLGAEGIRGIQAQFGLEQDGIAGRKTLAAWSKANPSSITDRAAPPPSSPTATGSTNADATRANFAGRAQGLGAALAGMRAQPAPNQAAAAIAGTTPGLHNQSGAVQSPFSGMRAPLVRSAPAAPQQQVVWNGNPPVGGPVVF